MPAAPDAIARVLSQVTREDRGRLLSALIAYLGDFQLAEDSLQDALETALVKWGRSGLPNNPRAWLLQVARRKAIDRIRRSKTLASKLDQEAILAHGQSETPEIPDERLRLIFTCCHPALDPKTRVALTLRTLGGLTTVEIAQAFLDSETAMGQRLSRAKAKIRDAGIPFVIPEAQDWDQRLNSVLNVIYLIFNQGYSGSDHDTPIRINLCEEAIYLAQLLNQLRPERAEIEGLIALMHITHARFRARMDQTGQAVSIEDQDRTFWDQNAILSGQQILDHAIARDARGPFQIKAAIAALHVSDPVDWRQIVLLYDALLQFEPTPVVQLNRAVALAEMLDANAGLCALEKIADTLQHYQPYFAARADLLARTHQITAARAAYDQAIQMSNDPKDIRFLKLRRDAL